MPSTKPTQAFVPVQEVRNGMIMLKEGGYRGVLMCSSINFALKSEDEQRGVISGFQAFLNTLDFSIQIITHSRRMDIRPYLALLAEREGAQATELMRIQLREYIQFVKNFIEGSEIMTKIFYVVIPYDAPAVRSVSEGLPFLGGGKTETAGLSSSFQESRIQLEQRLNVVTAGLMGCGVRAVQLDTEAVIELLYRSFNVGDVETPIKTEQ
jgi:hypothetical protein